MKPEHSDTTVVFADFFELVLYALKFINYDALPAFFTNHIEEASFMLFKPCEV